MPVRCMLVTAGHLLSVHDLLCKLARPAFAVLPTLTDILIVRPDALRLAVSDALCRNTERRSQFKEAMFELETEDTLGG